ncbi:MAG: ABC transporter permease [Candidatus Omnitrophica bacterium]|nr:ABC transporter permease [Candidatus Omnitrophota bacterium]
MSLLSFSIENIFTRFRRSLVALAGISISIALFTSVVLTLKNAQSAFRKPLQEAGADMIVQLRGEPCVWSIVKLPSDINPIQLKLVNKIRSIDEVAGAEGSLITWAFPVSNLSQMNKPGSPVKGHKDLPTSGVPCDYGPAGSFCQPSDDSAALSNFSPVVVVGVNPELGELGPIKKSQLKNIQGRYFTKEDQFVAILDKDFARTRNLRHEDNIDIGPRLANKIIGIIDPGYEAKIAGAQIFIPLKTAIEITGRGDIVDIIFVKLKGGTDPEAVKQKIRKALGDESVAITTSNDYLSSLAGFSTIAQSLMLAIFFIVILISILFIAKTAFGSALERSSEIGVLKAIGWKNKDVIKLIILENSILGFIGGLAGSLLGYLVSFIYKINLPSALPYYLNPYPPCSQYLVKNTLQVTGAFPINIFLLTILMAAAIQVLFGLFATIKILKITPADALKKL